jgi:hypothetical protein
MWQTSSGEFSWGSGANVLCRNTQINPNQWVTVINGVPWLIDTPMKSTTTFALRMPVNHTIISIILPISGLI